MNRQFLKDLEIEEEKIESIMAEHGKTINAIKDGANENKANIEEFEAVKNELQKYKDEAAKVDQLKEELEEIKAAKEATEIKHQVHERLKSEGAKDVDYLLFKLGGLDALEKTEDGSIKDLDGIVKGLKDSHKEFFDVEDSKNIIPNKIKNDDQTPGDDIGATFAKALNGGI